MAEDKLDEAAVAEALKGAAGWKRDGGAIVKTIETKDFAAALALVNAIGAAAEAADHHPDILMHGWNKVTVTLSTHSAGGLTALDFDLAKAIDATVTA